MIIWCVLILLAVIFSIVSFKFAKAVGWRAGFSDGFYDGWYDGKDDLIKYGNKPKDDKKQRRDKRGRFIK